MQSANSCLMIIDCYAAAKLTCGKQMIIFRLIVSATIDKIILRYRLRKNIFGQIKKIYSVL